ncbi:MAG: sigma-54-dependent Fis family transcriptional regulator [Deltaproteobacteria bacterium]|jgi:DNA-binding NtrC family response regulator|nr:MAG: sigma-54-dependent Fis family transcriptional regulator [Deltaproteobacteria bacterium]
MKRNILIVEDDEIFLKPLVKNIERAGYRVATTATAQEALNLLKEEDFDLVITDKKLPDMDGVELVRHIKTENPDTAVIMMTAFGTIESAVEVMKLGAEDYIVKPFSNEQILIAIEKALKLQELSFANKCRINKYRERFTFKNIVTQSKKMMEIFELVKNVVDLDTTVLIYGETGTGKELLANVIHFNSPRREKPFVKVNCAAIPEELFESELFGFKKGAFTGANENKRGLFQMANGGTILLDEIGEIPLRLQPKLLRVIEDKKVISLGSERSVDIDVRIIATTNKNLKIEVEKGNFREDLFYRLNVIPIELPPLRERKEDIPLLAKFFLRKYAEKFNKPVKHISEKAINTLLNYSWPGNVRELENIIERAVIVEKTDTITDIDLYPTKEKINQVDLNTSFKMAKAKVIEDFEKAYISGLLEMYGGKLAQAAKHAEMDVKNLWEKMKKYGIKRDAFVE